MPRTNPGAQPHSVKQLRAFVTADRDVGPVEPHRSVPQSDLAHQRLLGEGSTAHKLRRRVATTAYAGNRDLVAVQQLLGLSKPEATQRYTALPGDALRAAVAGGGVAS
jgi:integrase